MPKKQKTDKHDLSKLFLKNFIGRIMNQFPHPATPERKILTKKNLRSNLIKPPSTINFKPPQSPDLKGIQPIQIQKQAPVLQVKQNESADLSSYQPSIQYGNQSAIVPPVPLPSPKLSPTEVIDQMLQESPMEVINHLQSGSPEKSPMEVIQQLQPQSPTPMPTQPKIPAIDRILSLLNDPSILSVESPGPGKNLIINKAGLISIIPQTFSAEEIYTVLVHFSKETRIPLFQGVFRAALSNLLIAAVISEHAGSRFHIEKRHATPKQKARPRRR